MHRYEHLHYLDKKLNRLYEPDNFNCNEQFAKK